MTGDEALAWAHGNLPADPNDVVLAMLEAGWVLRVRNSGYARLGHPGESGRFVLVPLRSEYGDYPDLMAGVLATLKMQADDGRRAQRVLDGLEGKPRSV